jgi:DNA-binding protein HU-beta
MKKSELVDAIAEKSGLSKNDAKKAFDALTEVVLGTVAAKQDVELGSLGKIKVVHKEASTGRNPATGEQMQVPAKDVAKFTPGKALKDAALGAAA